MSLPSRPIMVRLSAAHAAAFDALRARHFGGLSQALLLKFMLGSFLERPIAEQAAIIDAQIKQPTVEYSPRRSPQRLPAKTPKCPPTK